MKIYKLFICIYLFIFKIFISLFKKWINGRYLGRKLHSTLPLCQAQSPQCSDQAGVPRALWVWPKFPRSPSPWWVCACADNAFVGVDWSPVDSRVMPFQPRVETAWFPCRTMSGSMRWGNAREERWWRAVEAKCDV